MNINILIYQIKMFFINNGIILFLSNKNVFINNAIILFVIIFLNYPISFLFVTYICIFIFIISSYNIPFIFYILSYTSKCKIIFLLIFLWLFYMHLNFVIDLSINNSDPTIYTIYTIHAYAYVVYVIIHLMYVYVGQQCLHRLWSLDLESRDSDVWYVCDMCK